MASSRITLGTVRRWVQAGEPFAMLTCYDAVTARWLWRGGARTLLVGDSAAMMVLGHDTTLPISVDLLVTLTAAVRRGAPDVFLMGDMPFGSYQCGEDDAVRNAMRFLTDGQADVVKLEVDTSFAPLVGRLAGAGVPVVAHIGSRPQHKRVQGRSRAMFREQCEIDEVVTTARKMVEAGAVMLLIEAVPAEVSKAVVEAVSAMRSADEPIPVIGCGAGPACHGHVVVLQDLLGMSDWQPPFIKPVVNVGEQIAEAARSWQERVATGRYLVEDHPYHLEMNKPTGPPTDPPADQPTDAG